MSKLNINRNTFFEKEELVNFQSFFASEMLLQVLLQASYSFGLITNDPSKFNKELTGLNIPAGEKKPFVVEQGTVNGSIKILSGMALTSQGQFIRIGVEDNVLIPNDSSFYWVKIAYTTRNYEPGYVNINNQGLVSGTTNFKGKVRGQSTNTPVCIRFEKKDGSVPLNNGIYQIANIVDDYDLMLSSATSFVPESNLRVIILGTLPLGDIYSDKQKEGLYTYDSYEISLVREVLTSTPPEKQVDEFYIARVQNSGGSVLINNSVEKEYWSLGNFFTGKK